MCVQGIPWQWPSGWDSVLLVPGGAGSILVPGRGTEILLAAYCGQKKKKKPPKNVYLNCIIAVCIPQLNYHLGRCLDCSCSQLCRLALKRETGTQ